MTDKQKELLRDNEQLCDLQLDGLFLIQPDDVFHFGTDAVLLSNFAKLPKGARVIDLGTGTGILPILLSAKTEAAHFTGVEIQEKAADAAKRNVIINGLEGKIDIIEGNITEMTAKFGKSSFDAVVTNPPYKRSKSGIRSDDDAEYIARHEVSCTLEDMIKTASELLVPYGNFYMVNRPERLADAIETMRKYRIEPKMLQFVSKDSGKAPVMFLIHGVHLGGKNLKVLPSLHTSEEK